MRRAMMLSLLCITAATACGASIQAVYEGDVRFEHCMALDARSGVKPTLRRACWEEWVKFYTFGQTRDRVEYAKARQKQLGSSSDFDEGDWLPAPSPQPPAAVPEPTSVLAPPPPTLSADGGATGPGDLDAGTDAADGGQDDRPPPGAECANECEESWNLCKQECKTPACDKGCTTKYKRCMRKCF
jgi:hypothetical protein